jgi:hypothetical protein
LFLLLVSVILLAALNSNKKVVMLLNILASSQQFKLTKMKKQILLLFAVLLTGTAFSQAQERKSDPINNYFSYSPDGRENYVLSEEQIIIKFLPGVSFEQQSDILKSEALLQHLSVDMMLPSPKVTIAKTTSLLGVEKLTTLLERLEMHNLVEYANPFLIYKDGTKQGVTDKFIVKLKNILDVARLYQMVNDNGLEIIENYKYDRKVYIIKVPKACGFNALEMANRFYETGEFSASEPDFLLLLKNSNTNSPTGNDESTLINTNDTFLDYQWSLHNIGSAIQYNGTVGSDLNVFAAWGISTGSAAIKVAILDTGVDLVHPDLLANLLPGFDATGLGSGGAPSGNDAHGTACAGIVAAVGNNNLGVTGIAYNCRVIPVRIFYQDISGNLISTSLGIGSGIDWAWQTGGADVLSNSWGGGSVSSLINDAIDRAVTQGRGGLGSHVLFAAGNNNGAVVYPANLPNVISVTAMSMCDQRKSPTSCDGETWWGSNYGTTADVSAPGVKIYTCDISGPAGYSDGDYTPTFNGTSSACPNAAGVMALILSANSSLSRVEARQILESTCNKVGGYTYDTNVSGQPNGIWSTNLGYGRVNALAALQLATIVCTSPPVAGFVSASPAFSCSSTPVTLSLDGITYSMGQTYQWQSSTDNNTWIIIPDATLIAYGTTVSATTYFRCLVTCSGNTSEATAVVVTIDPFGQVTVNGGSVESICLGESITLNVSGAINYVWSPATGLNQTNGTTVIANPTETTVYTITSTSSGGCSSAATITVNVNPLPPTAVMNSNSPLNVGETLNLTAEVALIQGYVLNSISAVSFIDISTSGIPITSISDDSRHLITIPAFTFNTVEYTTAVISTNGYFIFGANNIGAANYFNIVLPAAIFGASGSNAAVCAYWDDLFPVAGSSIVAQSIGNIYIVQWNIIKHFSTQAIAETITFQIQLNLVSGQINLVYPDVFFGNSAFDFGASATIGLNYSATEALQYSFNTASLQNGQSLTFTPKKYIYSWTGPNNFTSNEQNPSLSNVTQNAAGIYSLQLTNESGCLSNSSVTVNVVSANADLSSLTTTAGTIAPIFDAATTTYTVSVCDDTTSVTVTPTRSDATATIAIQINGLGYTTIPVDAESSALSLNLGVNPIDIRVTAQDGTTSKTYTIIVTSTVPVTPTFTQIDSICPETALSALPTTSTNGISGTWLPELNNLATTEYTFTPTASQCASTATMTIEVGTVKTWTAGAWSPSAPTSADAAVIAANYSQAADITACSLTINNNATVSIPSGFTVTLNNVLTVAIGSSFTLENDATLLQTTTEANVGLSTVKRNSASLFRQDYTLWSSPVLGQNLRGFSPQTLFNRFSSYDTAAGTNGAYVQEIITTADMNTKTFSNAKGYLIRMPNNWVTWTLGEPVPASFEGTYTGTLNNGAVSIPLSGANNKFNLVGNPYPSPISIAAFLAANTNITGTLYFWRKQASANLANLNSGYATLNTMGFTYPADLSIVPPVSIQMGQGFFVEATSVAPGNLIFNNEMRLNSNPIFFRNPNSSTELHRMWLNLSNATNVVGQTLIGYKTGATQGVDSGIDALYFNDSDVALTSLIDNNEYIIQGRSVPFVTTDIVPLGFKTDVAGSYTISLSNFDGLFADNQDIFLKDNSTGTVHNLKVAPYTFTALVGVFNTRFEVQYTNVVLGTDNPLAGNNRILIGVKNQQININAGSVVMEKIELIDVVGRVIFTQEEVNSTTATLENVVSANQMLVVRISTKENGVVTQKIIF